MEKLFTVAGYSTLNGETKARFATSMDRVKVLARNGHTDIQLQALPCAMTKESALAFLEGKIAPQAKVATAQATVQAETVAEVKDIAAIRAKNLETMIKTSERIQKMEERAGMREAI
jgi:hypothetical protein